MLADGGDEGFPAAMAADDKGVVPRRLQGSRKVDEAADAGDADHRAARDVREQGGQAEKADVAGYEDGHGPILIGQRSGKLTNIVTPVRRDQALPGSRKRRQHPLVADEDGRSIPSADMSLIKMVLILHYRSVHLKTNQITIPYYPSHS